MELKEATNDNNSLTSLSPIIVQLLEIFNNMNNNYKRDHVILWEIQKWLSRNKHDAKSVFSLAYEQRYRTAYASLLAFLYNYGVGVETNFVETFKWYQYAALRDDALAQNQLAYMYYAGVGIKANNAKAFQWWERSAKSSTCNGFAAGWLGRCYREPICVPFRILEKSFYWYQISAIAGEPCGQSALGDAYIHGFGVKPDYFKAVYWLRKSADQGEMSGIYRLADCIRYGLGAQKDIHNVIRLYLSVYRDGQLEIGDKLRRLFSTSSLQRSE